METLCLVIDDEPQSVELLKNILNSRKIKVLHATNPSDALTILKEKCPHLIVVDIDLKCEKTGLDFLEAVNKTPFKNVPAFVMSSSRESAHLKKAISLGIKDYIVKPADFNILSKKIFQMAKDLKENSPYQVKFDPAKPMVCQLSTPMIVVGVAETGFAASGSIKAFKPIDEPDFNAAFFDGMKIESPNFKLINTVSEPDSKIGYPYRALFQFKAMTETDQKKIRDYINEYKLKPLV